MPTSAFIQAFIRASESVEDLDTTINFFNNHKEFIRNYKKINDKYDHLSPAFEYYNKNKSSLQKCPVNINEWKEYIGSFCNGYSESHSFFLILAIIFIVRSHFTWPMVWTQMRYYAFKIVMDSIQDDPRKMFVNPEECVVCYELTSDVTILCKHYVCESCQRKLATCPYCRRVLLHSPPNGDDRMVAFIRDLLFFSPTNPCCREKIFCPNKFYSKNEYVRSGIAYKHSISLYYQRRRSRSCPRNFQRDAM